jgi:hypothetical protein
MEYEKAQCQQMDNHWNCLEDIELVLERMDKNITTTNKAIAATVRQNDRLTAQITGIRANAESAATNAKMDITNLRARLIPELQEASTSLFTKVKSLQGTLSVLGKTLEAQVKSNPDHKADTATLNDNVNADPDTLLAVLSTEIDGATKIPLRQQTSPAPEFSSHTSNLTHCFDSFWYHNASN